MNQTILQIAALIVPLIIAIVFHEVAHGWVARALGDPTAAERKRLSLNPLRHVDPIGTIVVPGFLKLVGAPVFGWAKPVPVDKWRLRNPRYGMMAVAAAGPGTNFVLAAIGAVLFGLLLKAQGPVEQPSDLVRFAGLGLSYFLQINIFLALFNLLPIPPFDGSHIVEGLLPEAAARQYEELRPFGMGLLVILLLVLPMVAPSLNIIERFVLPPFQWLFGHYVVLAEAVARS